MLSKLLNMDLQEQNLIFELKNPGKRDIAFKKLVDIYHQRIYWHVRKMVIDHDDANDLVQDIFVKIWKNIEKFREESNLFTWVYRIATNECLNFLAKRKRKATFSMEEAGNEADQLLENDPFISGEQVQLKLQKALLKLPDKQRLVFNMKYFDKMKYEDISKITKTSVGGLKASYHLAVKKIEEYLLED